MRFLVIPLATWILSLPLPSTVYATEMDPQTLDDFLLASLERTRFPTLSVAIVTSDKTLYSRSLVRPGLDVSVDGETPYFLGSISKSLTATLTLRLVEAGKLDLDARLVDYLSMQGKDVEAITVRHLLMQTSGFSAGFSHDLRAFKGDIGHLKLKASPGSHYEYSSVNYVLLGMIIEAATGLRLAEAMDEYLFTPLNMTNSSAGMTVQPGNSLVEGFTYFFGAVLPWENPKLGRFAAPMGYLISSRNDMARFVQAHLSGTFLTPATQEAMLMDDPNMNGRYGMGWFITRWGDERAFYHAGMTATSGGFVFVLPESDLGIVLLTNVNSGALFPATLDIVRGVIAISKGNRAESVFPKEWLFHLVVGLGSAVGIVQLVRRGRRWMKAGRPMGGFASRKAVLSFAIDFAAPIALFLVIRLVFEIPLLALLHVTPDLGIAVVLSFITAWGSGILKVFTTPVPAASRFSDGDQLARGG